MELFEIYIELKPDSLVSYVPVNITLDSDLDDLLKISQDLCQKYYTSGYSAPDR